VSSFFLSLSFTSDLFNLPLPALWTIVLGEYDRSTESGEEQRVSVDKIVLHEKYHNFRNDLVLMKLAKSANITPYTQIRKICLPHTCASSAPPPPPPLLPVRKVFENNKFVTKYDNVLERDSPIRIRDDNFLRQLNLNETEMGEFFVNGTAKHIVLRKMQNSLQVTGRRTRRKTSYHRRRNDKYSDPYVRNSFFDTEVNKNNEDEVSCINDTVSPNRPNPPSPAGWQTRGRHKSIRP
jgi:Trypsin